MAPPLAPLAEPATSPTRPGAWRGTSRPADPRLTDFGATLFDVASMAERPPRRADSVFDVCHAGVVLRALLFVHAVMAVGVAFAARGFSEWVTLAAAGSGVTLPAVLGWLLVACGLQRPLGALPLQAQWAAAVALGAAAGSSAAMLGSFVMPDTATFGRIAWVPHALAGAGLAAAVFAWLQMRAKASLPASTTARLAELQSRIRPHFLFNTLNTALALVRLDPGRAEGVLEDLAELFRVAISDSTASVTLGEEVELAKRYLAIEETRFGERLQVRWELDPQAAAARMPPLLLQPLVENAVRHGVEPSPDGGVIRIRTRVRHGRAEVTIANTVPPMPSRPGNGIALKNVRERLQLMHDVAAKFETESKPDVFRVQMVVPL